MANHDILIENGTIVTMDPDRRVLKESSVAIAGGKIVEIGPALELHAKYQAAKTIDARRKVIMPGLVDLHGHGGSGLLKGVGEHLTGFGWRNVLDFISYHVSAEWWYVESLLMALERVKAGTTCALYMLGTAPRGDNVEYPIRNVEAVEKVGIRSVVGVGPSRPPWPREYSYWKDGKRTDRLVTMEESFEATAEAIRLWQGRGTTLAQLWVSVSRLLNPNPADPMWDETQQKYVEPQAQGVRRIMEQYGVGFHVHAYGTAVRYVDEAGLGLLGPRTVLAHCWPLDPADVEILARTDTRVAHCPRARRVYSFKGRCPVPEMIEAGVVVGLGSDGPVSDRSLNLWEDMFLAPRWQRFWFTDGTLIPPGKSLEMATIDGARALGLDDRIGSIEVGKDADVILVDLFQPHIVPIAMEPSRLVHYARGSDVTTTIVQGKIVMENREVKTVNEAEVLEWAQQEAERTVELFGIQPLLEPSNRYWRHAHD